MAEKTMKLFIGYETKLASTVVVPEFKPPANYKDVAKIEAYLAEQKASFTVDAANMPYSGTFNEVFIIDPNARDDKSPEKTKLKALQYKWHPPEEEKSPVSLRVRNYLLKHYPNAWTNDTHNRKPPQVIIVGFDPRVFLKILGIECTLPSIAKPCPLGLWYSNSDHRDIGEAICPRDFKGLTPELALKYRRPIDKEDGKKWDEITKGWTGPGKNAEQDARIAIELATQLGFLDD